MKNKFKSTLLLAIMVVFFSASNVYSLDPIENPYLNAYDLETIVLEKIKEGTRTEISLGKGRRAMIARLQSGKAHSIHYGSHHLSPAEKKLEQKILKETEVIELAVKTDKGWRIITQDGFPTPCQFSMYSLYLARDLVPDNHMEKLTTYKHSNFRYYIDFGNMLQVRKDDKKIIRPIQFVKMKHS